MPIKYLFLILASVISAGALTVWVAVTAAGSTTQTTGFWMIAPIVMLGSFLLWRYIVKRLE